MILISFVLVIVAAVALGIAFFDDGLTFVGISIGSALLALLFLIVGVLRSRPRRKPVPAARPQGDTAPQEATWAAGRDAWSGEEQQPARDADSTPPATDVEVRVDRAGQGGDEGLPGDEVWARPGATGAPPEAGPLHIAQEDDTLAGAAPAGEGPGPDPAVEHAASPTPPAAESEPPTATQPAGASEWAPPPAPKPPPTGPAGAATVAGSAQGGPPPPPPPGAAAAPPPSARPSAGTWAPPPPADRSTAGSAPAPAGGPAPGGQPRPTVEAVGEGTTTDRPASDREEPVVVRRSRPGTTGAPREAPAARAPRAARRGAPVRRSEADRFEEALVGVEGIDADLRRSLYGTFSTMRRLRGASVADLEAVEGMSPDLARRVHQALHG